MKAAAESEMNNREKYVYTKLSRKLFDDAQRPKIEAFIKKLRELTEYRARADEINLFLAAMRAILWELARTEVIPQLPRRRLIKSARRSLISMNR